jgi:hypothetical protein
MVEASLALGATFLPDDATQSYDPIDNRVLVCGLLLEWWRGEFPDNRRRLGMFALNLLHLARLTTDEFRTMLETPRARELAEKKSLSIHQAIVILLVEERIDLILKELRSGRKRYLVITTQMEDVSEPCRLVPADIRVSINRDEKKG